MESCNQGNWLLKIEGIGLVSESGKGGWVGGGHGFRDCDCEVEMQKNGVTIKIGHSI